MTKKVNEQTAANAHWQFFDTHNSPATPVNLRYAIRDLTNDREVRGWTEVPPLPEIDIAITAEDNTMLHTKQKKPFEERVMVIQGNVGLETQFSEEVSYWIRNLRGLN